MASNAWRIFWLTLTLVLATGAALIATKLWPVYVYYQERNATNDDLREFLNVAPEEVDPSVWEAAHTWAIIAFHNVCFSPEHVTIEELRRFHEDIRRRKGDAVDVSTIDWIWERLAQTGPGGQRYYVKFWPQYREAVNAAGATR